MTWTHELEKNPEIKFGFYLRPSVEVCQSQAMVHDLLKRQYGLVAGGVFMPHATIKGFFRSDASLVEINAAFDRAVVGHSAIPIVNNGVMASGRRGLALNVHQNEFGRTNPKLQALHVSVMDEIELLIHPDCHFSAGEGVRDEFFAHLTLAMRDIPDFAIEEIHEFVRALEPLGPPRFYAEYFHLFAFQSDAWDGEWWHTLEWTLLNTWKLPLQVDNSGTWTMLHGKWQTKSFTNE
ncbi:MAG: 2'-5' RNA ligase family protein [Thermomicrobiales bacterium]